MHARRHVARFRQIVWMIIRIMAARTAATGNRYGVIALTFTA
jgi:hypothetical protein